MVNAPALPADLFCREMDRAPGPAVTMACQGPIPPPQTSADRAGVYRYHLEGEDVEKGETRIEMPSPTAPTYVAEDISNQARPENFKPQAAACPAQSGADIPTDRPGNGKIPIATAAPGAIPMAQAYDPNHPGPPPQIVYIQGQNQPMSQDEIFAFSIFVLGWFFWFPWILACCVGGGMRSQNPRVRCFNICSVCMLVFTAAFIVAFVVAAEAASV